MIQFYGPVSFFFFFKSFLVGQVLKYFSFIYLSLWFTLSVGIWISRLNYKRFGERFYNFFFFWIIGDRVMIKDEIYSLF